MIVLAFLILIGSIVLFGFACSKLSKANSIEILKNYLQLQVLLQFEALVNEVNKLTYQKNNILLEIQKEQEIIDSLYLKAKAQLASLIEAQNEIYKNAGASYIAEIELAYDKIETEYDTNKKRLDEKKLGIEKEISELKATLHATIEARRRELEKENQLDFYKITLTQIDMDDIDSLVRLKHTFNRQVVISKIIWSEFYQKKVTELCNRVLGNKKVCGIYKITDLTTGMYYIGRSVNISDRWKQHCKCGCGIEASATNKLYTAMLEHNLWNFSFELLESCSETELIQKEKFYIELYEADKVGMNAKSGDS